MAAEGEVRVVRSICERGGERLDVFVASLPEIPSRARARRLIDEGRVTVNGSPPAKAGVRLAKGDAVRVDVPPPEPSQLLPEPIPLDILFEDRDIIVISKRKGMVVHPAPGHAAGTLVHALLHHCPSLEGIGGVRRPGIVHRLDKDTSGVMVVAKTAEAHRALVRAIKAREVARTYLALVHGLPKARRGIVEAPIGRHPVRRKEMSVLKEGGRKAVTRFEVEEEFEAHALLRVMLETGRTHQIRVHLAHIGHPVVGDPVYGRGDRDLVGDGQALHAVTLRFAHPITREALRFDAPPPQSFKQALMALRLGFQRGGTEASGRDGSKPTRS